MKRSAILNIAAAALLGVLHVSPLYAQDVIEVSGLQGVAMHFASWTRNTEELVLGGAAFPSPSGARSWGGAGVSLIAPGNDGLAFTGFNFNAGALLSGSLALTIDYMNESGPSFEGGLREKHRSFSFGAIFRKGTFQLDGGLEVLQQNFRKADPWTGVLAAEIGAGFTTGGFRARLAVEDLGFTKVMSDSGQSFSIPSAASASLGYGLGAGSFGFEARMAARAYFFGGYGFGAGASVDWKRQLFLRAGFNRGSDSPVPDYFSLGLGGKAGGFGLDAGILLGKGLADGSIFISAKYSF